MINGIRLLHLQFLWCLKSRADLQAENLMLRYQIGVLGRSMSRRVRTTRIDRLSFVWLYRLWPNSIGDVQIIHRKTSGALASSGVQGVLAPEVRILRTYFVYYNESRTHLALSKDAPVPRVTSPPGDRTIVAIPQVGGLHHRYGRRAA